MKPEDWKELATEKPANGQRCLVLSRTLPTENPLLREPFWIASYRDHKADRDSYDQEFKCVMKSASLCPDQEFECHDGIKRDSKDMTHWVPICGPL